MFKAVLLLVVAMLPIWLIYTFGLWMLMAFVALPAVVFVFSRGPARGDEVNRGGHLTGYHTTRRTDF